MTEDGNYKFAQSIITVFERVENNIGKKKPQDFLLFPQCFQKSYPTWLLKLGFVWKS